MKMISKKLSLGLAAALLTSLLSGNVHAALDYISEGLEQGETVCLSSLVNAIQGMTVRPVVAGEAASSSSTSPRARPSPSTA